MAAPHQTWTEDTIAAISTPIGEGALAVIRLSGVEALAVADAVFKPIGTSDLAPSGLNELGGARFRQKGRK